MIDIYYRYDRDQDDGSFREGDGCGEDNIKSGSNYGSGES